MAISGMPGRGRWVMASYPFSTLQVYPWCDLSIAFSARQVWLFSFTVRPIVWKMCLSVFTDNMYPFLRPAVSGRNCAYYSQDYMVIKSLLLLSTLRSLHWQKLH